jgi:hypothetical protein
MFAIFGLGWGELVVLGFIAVPLILFGVVFPMLRKSAPAPRRRDEIADLRAEIADLRDEVERLKNGSGKKDSSSGITTDGPR